MWRRRKVAGAAGKTRASAWQREGRAARRPPLEAAARAATPPGVVRMFNPRAARLALLSEHSERSAASQSQ